ncbi:MAG: galactose-1-phosphate uridylyltransferase [Acidimicrobiia bacterium]|nr:galactose-1-phosphate uridylyltransferase [Acidimicrobiia bacterium]
MSQLRLNPLTGRWVTVSTGRADRPGELISRQSPVESDPDRLCPFCPGNEEATPPALETYGASGRWQVRVVPNLFPAFVGNNALRVQNLGPVWTQATASGVHEVLVFSPDHTGSWADLDDKQAGLAMAAIRDRMEDHARRSTVRYTQAIVNAGREAGASLEHPHGQLLGIPFVPGEIAEEEAGFRRHEGSCLLCTTAEAEVQAGHRVVLADEQALVICPFWSGAPYEMLVIPRSHEVHLESTSPPDVVAVGRAIRDALLRLRRHVGDTAYNLVFHTAPHHHEGPFHWHVHIVPRLTSLAGFEQGTGVMINIVAPELAAQHLAG